MLLARQPRNGHDEVVSQRGGQPLLVREFVSFRFSAAIKLDYGAPNEREGGGRISSENQPTKEN